MNTGPVAPRELNIDHGAMRYAPDRLRTPDTSVFDPGAAHLAAVPVQVGGRQAAWFVTGEFGAAVLRQYRRGGLISRLSQNRYLWLGAERTRSFAEFNLLYFMHQQGLPVPKPLAAAYWHRGLTYCAAILVERVPNIKTLAKTLDLARHDAVAGAIFAIHEAGVWHADLNAFNILLNEQGRVWLIDFDRGRRQAMPLEQRNANLLRLRRSLAKIAGAQGIAYWAELNRAYQMLWQARNTV